ncbi:Tautomerase-3 domain-containing protein [Mycena venus]|uniref:Tautomerase-3 domain-containing protein n=1 Tax=Mycena venus TaxID=2733690 RepID=A0A8H7DBT1_9AGAR|nr:Tautomerase-3 domain-containing protein [Mycena venus]
MDRYEPALAPFTKARGIDWEVQITDCERLLWNMNGMAPPLENTEEEKIWKQENRAVPPEEMEVLKRRG